ncbi:MAG: Small GTP-binding domain protein [Promethearchaeota archaeon]|jgi:small GTP-binding protein|nr:MAG: Small GTP-binding domain protein [Candidatus Lokiarchaeota archaeon]
MSEPNYIVKICLLGEAAVGKTSLVYRFVQNTFRDSYKSTLGVNLLKKDLTIGGYGEVSAQIWDLGGQESFRSLRKLYLEGANGALVIYDMTNRKTFDKLDDWVDSFKEARGQQPLLLIGNKADLKNKIEVEEEEGKSFAEKNNMDFIITSAKTGLNVEEAFKDLIKTILDKIS